MISIVLGNLRLGRVNLWKEKGRDYWKVKEVISWLPLSVMLSDIFVKLEDISFYWRIMLLPHGHASRSLNFPVKAMQL